MPNLRGASPVGHEGGGRSYVAQTVGRSEPGRRRHGHGGVLGAVGCKGHTTGATSRAGCATRCIGAQGVRAGV